MTLLNILSAMKENEAYLDSIQGRIDIFNNEVQSFWMETIDSDMVKGVVDLGTSIVGLVRDIGLLPTALAGVLLYFTAIKKNNPITMFKELSANAYNYGLALQKIEAIGLKKKAVGGMDIETFKAGPMNEYAAAVRHLTAEQQAAALASAGLTEAQIQETMAKNGVEAANIKQAISETNVATAKAKTKTITCAQALEINKETTAKLSDAAATWLQENASKKLTIGLLQEALSHGKITQETYDEIVAKYGLVKANGILSTTTKGLFATMKAAILSNPVGWILTIVSAVSMLASSADDANEKLQESISNGDQLRDSYESTSKTISDNIKNIKALESEYTELSRCVDENGNNISLSTKDYERYKEIVSSIIDMSPDVVKGYDAEGNAIINKNKLIEESIRLLKEEQQLEAQRAVSGSNWTDMIHSLEAEIGNIPSKEKTSKDFMTKLMTMMTDENVEWYHWFSGTPSSVGPNGFLNFITDAGLLQDTALQDLLSGAGYIPLVGGATNWLNDVTGTYEESAEEFAPYASYILEYLRDNESYVVDQAQYFTQEQYDQLMSYLTDYTNADKLKDRIQAFQSEYTEMLYSVAQTTDDFYNLDEKQQLWLKKYIEAAFPIPEDGDLETQANEAKAKIASFVKKFAGDKELQNLVSEAYDLQFGKNKDGITLDMDSYYEARNTLLQNASKYGEETVDALTNIIDTNDFNDAVNHLYKMLVKDSSENIMEQLGHIYMDDMLYIYYNISAEPGTMEIGEVFEKMNELRRQSGETVTSVKSYASIIEDISKYNDIINQTSEIATDNIRVTQEYKDALKELGISEDEINECFYENNKLVVKNAKALNNLVKSTKLNAAQNAKLAKSQARLQYYELSKKMLDYIDANGEVVEGGKEQILSLYNEMNALEKVISKYSRLETQLLGTVNAYEEFKLAQEADSETDYIGNVEEMISALGEAFNKGELGTESAQAAIMALVPKSVYEDLDTVDEKMAAIYKYFKEGKLSQYFDIEFDDDGAITGAEMKLGNMRKFIEDGLAGVNGKKVFEGSDWQHFEFSDEFLDGLEEADDKLQYFADSMDVSKDVAFAFIKEMNDHDIDWLNGDYSSMFDVFTPETLEKDIHNTTQEIADLNAQLANGEIDAKDYTKAMYGLKGQLDSGQIDNNAYNESIRNLSKRYHNGEITQDEYTTEVYGLSWEQDNLMAQSREEVALWHEKTKQLEEHKNKLNELYNLLEEEGNNGLPTDVSYIQEDIESVTGEINKLTGELAGLEEPTEVTLQFARDSIQSDMKNITDEIGDVIEGKHYRFNVEAAKYEVILDENDPKYQKVNSFVNLLNEQHVIDTIMGEGATDVVTTLETVNDTLTNIQKILEHKFNLQVDTNGAVSEVETFQSAWENIKDKSVTLWTKVSQVVGDFFTRTPDEGDGADANGTAHVYGTAHATGSWGAPKTETALVGELGPEMLVRNGRWTTVGDNGAEFREIRKGDIIFNH